MASLPNHTFEHGNLVGKVILFTENARHAAIIVLKRTDWCAFGSSPTSIAIRMHQQIWENRGSLGEISQGWSALTWTIREHMAIARIV